MYEHREGKHVYIYRLYTYKTVTVDTCVNLRVRTYAVNRVCA